MRSFRMILPALLALIFSSSVWASDKHPTIWEDAGGTRFAKPTGTVVGSVSFTDDGSNGTFHVHGTMNGVGVTPSGPGTLDVPAQGLNDLQRAALNAALAQNDDDNFVVVNNGCVIRVGTDKRDAKKVPKQKKR